MNQILDKVGDKPSEARRPVTGHGVSVVAHLPVPSPNSGHDVELVCPSGHRTTHSRARLMRLNDGWCGKCGADIDYTLFLDGEHTLAETRPDIA